MTSLPGILVPFAETEKYVYLRTKVFLLEQILLPIVDPSFSIIREHYRQTYHVIREDNFIIIYKSKNTDDLRTATSLHIIKDKQDFNYSESSTRLFVIS